MNFGRGLFPYLALTIALVGCSTIRRARDAQAEVAPRGEEAQVSAMQGRLDLRGKSLAELVDFALTNRPSIASARLAVEDARLSLRELAADAPLVSDTPWTAPSISLTGDYSESSAGTHWHEHDYSTRGGPSAGVSVDLLLWDFGRYDAKARAQAERVVAAEVQLVDEGYTVFDEVASAYFTYLEKCALLDVAQTNETEYADHLSQAEARLEAGEANRLDVLRARLDYTQSRQKTVAASNLVTTSGAELMRALGVDASRGTCTDVFGHVSDGIRYVRRGFARTTYGVDEAFNLARTNAPSMRVARAKLRAASHQVDYTVSDLMPSISATTSFRWSDPLWYWSWGVSGVQSIFQGFRKTTAVDRAVVSMRQAATDVDTAEQSLSVSLETAIANRDDSVKALETAVASIRSARENLEMVRRQLSVGDVSRIELSEAIAAHSTAVGDCVTAFYQGQRAEATLFAKVGRYPVYQEERVEEDVK